MKRNIFPQFSVLNPLILNKIRVSKRRKYIYILNRKVEREKRLRERQTIKYWSSLGRGPYMRQYQDPQETDFCYSTPMQDQEGPDGQ